MFLPLDRLRVIAGADPDRVLFVADGVDITAAALKVRIEAEAASYTRLPPTVGILAPNGIDWVVAALALVKAGRRVVPIPEFFAPLQIVHVLRDARIGHVLVGSAFAQHAAALPVAWSKIGDAIDGTPAAPAPAEFVIYTSGSTGTPKGVLLDAGQIAWSAQALVDATGADSRDRYLSTLPLALLLEAIGAVFAPILAGGVSHLDGTLPHRALRGDAALLIERMNALRPSMTILVPDLLRGIVEAVEEDGHALPGSLRFVAVGGAAVPAALNARALACGIPVHEGYGLSECCSVVTLNRPAANAPGTAGRPLPGLTVEIVDGEIVVTGPSVMRGYVGGASTGGRWPTGDLGRFDAQGNLVVEGRKDNLLVTALGRNVNPEWVEKHLLADPRLARAIVIGAGQPTLTAVLVPRTDLDRAEALALVRSTTASLPAYAQPGGVLLTTEADLARHALLTANGRIRRAQAAAHFLPAPAKQPRSDESKTMTFFDRLSQETAADRAAFLAIPALRKALQNGVPLDLYLAYLGQAYHHVRFTVPLLGLALARTGGAGNAYREALIEYIDEEKGHERWILDDIAALGGDAEAVRTGEPGTPCRAMVGYVHYAIEHVSPYAMLGMVHVLEGMSVALAETAASVIKGSLGAKGAKGFTYLTSHGGLDKEHVAFFKTLVNEIDDPAAQAAIVGTAKVVYRLFGDIFRDLGEALMEQPHAA